jgi:1-phosphofructokinase family hexose kinase
MILCVTSNPAIDRTLTVPELRLGAVARATHTLIAAGGKGLNVARVVRALGGAATCAGFLGGHSGRLLAELAEREGLRGAWTWTASETRTCVIVVDSHGRDATVVNEPGLPVAPDDWARLTADVVDAAAAADYVCLSGSLPPGSPPDMFAGLLRALCDAGRPVWVDTSGPALAAALTVASVGIKVNGDEAGALLGGAIAQPEQALAAARALHQRTGGPVVLTLGGRGAVLASAAGSWHAHPPPLQIVSTVGSGDAFFAGLVVALASGLPEPQALCRAVAAGAANTLSIGGGRLAPADYEAILGQTTLADLQ